MRDRAQGRDMPARPRLLLLAMYRLEGRGSGPIVRIREMQGALARKASLDLISGARFARAGQAARYLLAGRLRGLDGIYVESSTSLPGPADLFLLWRARRRGVPVVTYIRDAYQLFPEYYPLTSVRRRVSRAAFVPMLQWLMRCSSTVAFPSRGLAQAVLGAGARTDAAALLPPGAPSLDAPPIDPAARAILYVGSLAHAASGGELLARAYSIARTRAPHLALICVVPPGQSPPRADEAGIELLHASGAEIVRLLPRVLATIVPRPRTIYNDLALPIKLFEYLAYRRPLISTDATEAAALVRDAGCGLVASDTPEAMGEAMVAMAEAPAEQLLAWAEAAGRAAAANSWDARAVRVLDLMGVVT